MEYITTVEAKESRSRNPRCRSPGAHAKQFIRRSREGGKETEISFSCAAPGGGAIDRLSWTWEGGLFWPAGPALVVFLVCGSIESSGVVKHLSVQRGVLQMERGYRDQVTPIFVLCSVDFRGERIQSSLYIRTRYLYGKILGGFLFFFFFATRFFLHCEWSPIQEHSCPDTTALDYVQSFEICYCA